MSLTFKTTIETVTYEGDTGTPGISGYGRDIAIQCVVENDITLVIIEGNKFMLEQIEGVIAQAKVFEKAAKIFNEGVENL